MTQSTERVECDVANSEVQFCVRVRPSVSRNELTDYADIVTGFSNPQLQVTQHTLAKLGRKEHEMLNTHTDSPHNLFLPCVQQRLNG